MHKKVLLIIMDGIGISQTGIGDAVSMANTPNLDYLLKTFPHIQLKAHGMAVGLPSDDDMGNSEVGHNALGCGQIYPQGAKLVNLAIESNKMFESVIWKRLINNCLDNLSTLHFIGLLSDGNVHSNINHLFSMIKRVKSENLKRVRIHILLDGRDVPSTSAIKYVKSLEKLLSDLNHDGFDGKIASGGGRMKITMDRYQADWEMVKTGWDIHVNGTGRKFNSAAEAIQTYRDELGVIDQDLPGFVIESNGEPVGKIKDKDSVIFFNFRGDRAIELSMAFDNDDFSYFERGKTPEVFFAGMLQYDGDLNLPKNYLVSPPDIKQTLSELLVKNHITQYAVSETQKYGHVTYFWNGNKSGKFEESLETYHEIKSDRVSFDQRPWMKSAQITDNLIEIMESGKYNFIRCNFPNGDMVGHTGNIDASIIAVEAVDLAIGRIIKSARKESYTVIITADHGNCDEMLEKDKDGKLRIRTAHSLNPVYFILCDSNYTLKDKSDFGLANVAPTIAQIFDIKIPDLWQDSMVK